MKGILARAMLNEESTDVKNKVEEVSTDWPASLSRRSFLVLFSLFSNLPYWVCGIVNLAASWLLTTFRRRQQELPPKVVEPAYYNGTTHVVSFYRNYFRRSRVSYASPCHSPQRVYKVYFGSCKMDVPALCMLPLPTVLLFPAKTNFTTILPLYSVMLSRT
ncbi:unnamed protein product [Ectocarpus sp. 13 AM-2016]